jgi:hypothetical protein
MPYDPMVVLRAELKAIAGAVDALRGSEWCLASESTPQGPPRLFLCQRRPFERIRRMRLCEVRELAAKGILERIA